MLASFVLTLNYNAGRKMRDSNSTFCFLNVLTAGAGGTVNVNSELGWIDDDIADFVSFWKYGNCACRGMYTSLRFGFRYALNTMSAAFKLQFGICTLAHDFHNDFFVAA